MKQGISCPLKATSDSLEGGMNRREDMPYFIQQLLPLHTQIIILYLIGKTSLVKLNTNNTTILVAKTLDRLGVFSPIYFIINI